MRNVFNRGALIFLGFMANICVCNEKKMKWEVEENVKQGRNRKGKWICGNE
jgi:hypothetical protein